MGSINAGEKRRILRSSSFYSDIQSTIARRWRFSYPLLWILHYSSAHPKQTYRLANTPTFVPYERYDGGDTHLQIIESDEELCDCARGAVHGTPSLIGCKEPRERAGGWIASPGD